MGNANLTVEASTYELAHRGVPRTAVTDLEHAAEELSGLRDKIWPIRGGFEDAESAVRMVREFLAAVDELGGPTRKRRADDGARDDQVRHRVHLLRPGPAIQLGGEPEAGRQGLEGGGAGAADAPRVPAFLRQLHDRRRYQPEGVADLHGPQLDHRDPGPLRASHARRRSRGGRWRIPTSRRSRIGAPIGPAQPSRLAHRWRRLPTNRLAKRSLRNGAR